MSERPSLLARLLRPIVQLRDGEAVTCLLMFLYSFLAMTSYNIVKPISKSEFISHLGADQLPWVTFAMGITIGVIMQGYTKLIALVPRRSMIPVTQVGIVVMLLLFWVLFTFIGKDWVAVAYYIVVQILAILLISQFWTLANDVYDPRQAKRIFGFIGGGASLGGAMGSGLTAFLVESVGSRTMMLMGAGVMIICLLIVMTIVRREKSAGTSDASKTGEEDSVSGGEALRLLRSSRQLQIISLVIAFGAMASNIVHQQVSMAVPEVKGSLALRREEPHKAWPWAAMESPYCGEATCPRQRPSCHRSNCHVGKRMSTSHSAHHLRPGFAPRMEASTRGAAGLRAHPTPRLTSRRCPRK